MTGIVYCVASVALADRLEDAGSRLTPPLIAATGVGLIGSGVFVTDPVADCPADTATSRTQTTRGGQLHDLFALPIFLGISAAALTSAHTAKTNGRRAWASYSRASAGIMTAAAILFSAAFAQTARLTRWGGLLQRVAISTGFGWLSAVFARARRRESASPHLPATAAP